MSMKHLGILAQSLGLSLFCAAMTTLASGEPRKENGSSSILPAPLPMPLPSPLPPQLLAQPAARSATSATTREIIGSAEMEPNRAIRLHLWPPAAPTSQHTFGPDVPWAFPQERIGYGEIEIQWTDAVYTRLLKHLGGLHPGEVKAVPRWRADENWHCIIDPDRGPCSLEHLLQ